jgi:hypothetical protein
VYFQCIAMVGRGGFEPPTFRRIQVYSLARSSRLRSLPNERAGFEPAPTGFKVRCSAS